MLSPAKVNLTLHVFGQQPDGYHALDSIVVPLAFGDDITLTRAESTTLEIIPDGVDLSGLSADPEKNLALRALRLLEQTSGRALPTHIQIRKRIPLGGGLGGGSSNAATVLCEATRLWQLPYNKEQLSELGAQLGSDVPLFVLDGTVRMQGRGERVQRLPMEGAKPLYLVLINDGTHCPTPQVYRTFDQMQGAKVATNCKESLTAEDKICNNLGLILQAGEVERVADQVSNDLERPCLSQFPAIECAKRALEKAGALGVTLSGSGATLFGLVHSQEEGEQILADPALVGYWRACTQTLPDGVMAAHGPLTPIVLVRIQVGQPAASE